jgi:hypothetical protein
MTAKITGFRTRSQLKLRNPRSVSFNITPSRGGVVGHWGGPRQSLGNHDRCEQIWRSWQNYHMDSHGWVDIAYTAAFCNHGFVLAGRGFGTRTAANGTNDGNQNYYAFVWIGGEGNSITRAALDAYDWLIMEARRRGAGRRVRTHRSFTGSACGGPQVNAHSNLRDNKNIIVATDTYVIDPNPPKEPDMSQYGPENWDKADRDAFAAIIDGRLNNAIVKNTITTESPNGRNFAWFQRRLEALGTATLQNVNALTRVVESQQGIDQKALAQTIADELGESLEEIGKAAGKAAAEVTASDVVRRHGEALIAGIGNN